MFVYHLSHKSNRDSILKKGLLLNEYRGTYINYEPRLFVTTTVDVYAFYFIYNFENIDIWKFDIDEKELIKDGFSESEYHFYIKKPIKSKNIKLWKKNTSIEKMDKLLKGKL